ncbi:MAG: hypothetical protein MZV63_13160 [Marinilabiliales bacterium]|nr:hypothetical protein [Marinilabiliales bacterium]
MIGEFSVQRLFLFLQNRRYRHSTLADDFGLSRESAVQIRRPAETDDISLVSISGSLSIQFGQQPSNRCGSLYLSPMMVLEMGSSPMFTFWVSGRFGKVHHGTANVEIIGKFIIKVGPSSVFVCRLNSALFSSDTEMGAPDSISPWFSIFTLPRV